MNEQHIDTIHRYLTGMMDAAEQQAFEAEIQQNPALRREVELERMLLAGIEYAGRNDARKTIESVQTKLRQEGFFDSAQTKPMPTLTIVHSSKVTIMKRILAIAATFIVLAGGVWFFMNQETPLDTNALFTQYYQPKDDIQRAKSIIETLDSYGLAGVQTDTDTLKMALQLYEADKYNEALALLKGFAEIHPENDVAQYYIGVIHISQGRYAKAIEVLLPISRSEESALKNDALWNLGLCYMKTENGVEDARNAFTKLSGDNNYPNHRGAKAVLEQLLPQ
ncbi:MAG: tetratricopeptide repeat protein [Lewinellaceae bacterium]|nr:tetratricopeptide repeat protein [Lewinellaceae bacterium]